MTANVVTVTPDTAVHDVAKLMIDRRISGMPVVNSGGHLVGIVTDGDLYRRSELGTDRRRKSWLEIFGFDIRQARDFVESHAATAGDVMTKRVFAVTPQTLVQQIANLFERQRIRRVPVLANGVVIGIVSRANLVQALASAPTEDMRVNLSDRRVRDLVIAEYGRLPWGMPSEGNVIVTDGVVHVWGYMPSKAELDALRVAVEGVPGVKGFEDHSYQFSGDVGHRQQEPSEIIVEEAAAAKADTSN
jgi:CBS domain-containing protein